MKMQLNAQNQSYKVNFPQAKYSIINLKTDKIGRIIVNRSEREIQLVDIALLPDYRNLGIGSKIISDLIVESQNTGLPIILQVARDNRLALKLYKKLNFKIISENEMKFSMCWEKHV